MGVVVNARHIARNDCYAYIRPLSQQRVCDAEPEHSGAANDDVRELFTIGHWELGVQERGAKSESDLDRLEQPMIRLRGSARGQPGQRQCKSCPFLATSCPAVAPAGTGLRGDLTVIHS